MTLSGPDGPGLCAHGDDVMRLVAIDFSMDGSMLEYECELCGATVYTPPEGSRQAARAKERYRRQQESSGDQS